MKAILCALLLCVSFATFARSTENEALIAIYHDDEALVERLLAQNPSLQDWRSEFVGSSLLHYAVVSESPKALKTLLRLGFNVNQRNKAGLTALHMAAYFDAAELCQVLMLSGADASIKNALGQTASQVAQAKGAKACLKFLPK